MTISANFGHKYFIKFNDNFQDAVNLRNSAEYMMRWHLPRQQVSLATTAQVTTAQGDNCPGENCLWGITAQATTAPVGQLPQVGQLPRHTTAPVRHTVVKLPQTTAPVGQLPQIENILFYHIVSYCIVLYLFIGTLHLYK